MSKTHRNRKLLYVINHMDWFWSHRLPLAQGARGEGWDVMVASTGAQHDEKLTLQGFQGYELPPFSDGLSALSVLKIIYAVHRLIQKEKPDLLHVITLKYAFMAGLAARLHKHIRIVHTIAGLGYLFAADNLKAKMLRIAVGPFLKLALKHPRAQIIFQNPDDQEIMVRRGFVRASQCHLIRGSGVDLENFCYRKEPESAEPIVLMPTRLLHDKGVGIFVDVARLLKNKGIRARFQIAGGVTTTNPMAISENEMKEMVADGAAEWLGKVDDMPGLLHEATIIVYPSYYREGVPKVLLEAASCGRPIITTDHPGCREAVVHEENGYLVPVRDAEQTARALEILLADKSKRETMGIASRKLAEDHFDVRLITRRTLSVYNTALVS